MEIIMKNQNRKNREKIAPAAKQTLTDRSVKTLANSIFKSLTNEGCDPKDIIGVSTQLLSLVTTELQEQVVEK